MNRIITVKGIGKVSAKPDLIVLTMNLETKDMEYEKTIQKAAVAITDLQESIMAIGFQKTDIKTRTFDVSPHFENERDKNGNYKNIFMGYVCTQDLKLEFDLDMQKMSEVLTALVKCSASPEFDIEFTVKDKNAISESLLINATENAKSVAMILAKASGVKLGQLINIDYNWGEIRLYSNTRYRDSNMDMCEAMPVNVDIEPEDIDVSDTVTYVWEIL